MKTYIKLLNALDVYLFWVSEIEHERHVELINYFVHTMKECLEKEMGLFRLQLQR
ncbi:TPA: hypothetical protein KNN56_001780 [Clostridioides difficile]|uniref:hypothetical protein n=1 Tax=Clostridioides difficile TaxID=1496 RepID=UPI00038C783C|nr:hypothetical protein [Clostridioides difficile]ELX4576155.1 hypothetical protein [Clostridioides difficile]EQK76203.1 hypothetical protein QEE_1805 [Clostridioides difficile CD113]MBH6986785.1 hypothetical protein [Clostridioides difficile]MBH7139328.1 hypothetical protein [Clostridioides difficile]MBY2144964.1 hypothetical protein [Clostridioides difficile]